MSSIPDEVYHEILLRVPVKTAGVCKCVCKSWLSLISSPDFVKSHLNLTIQKNNPKVILNYDDWDNQCVAAYSVSYDSISSYRLQDDAVEIYYPVRSVQTVGTCDGLFCRIGFEVGSDRDVLFLWNPATKELKELPESPNESESSVGKEIGICGFGYDYKTDDYKVVKLLQYIRDVEDSYPIDRTDPSQGMSLVDVYTMRSNSWKSIESVPYSFPICGVSGVLVNGVLHWLGHTETQDLVVVVSLNVSEEKFEEMQLPKHSYEKKKEFTTMGVLEGCLCVVVNVVDVGFEVCRMQDYGVRESWNICHVVTNERILNDSYLKLVWFRNGEILFEIPGDLVFYDPKHRTTRESNVHTTMFFINEEIYFGSLVSVNSGTYVEEPGTIEEE